MDAHGSAAQAHICQNIERGDRYVISYKTMPFPVGNVFIDAFLFVLVYKNNVQLYYTQRIRSVTKIRLLC